MTDPTSSKPVMLDWALEYATEGFFVLPLRPRRKEPASRHGVHDATIDARQLSDIWTRQPSANIGISCGPSGLLVLDVDGPDARAELARLEQEHGRLPATRTVLTGRGDGGEHRYFRIPQGAQPLRNGTLKDCRRLEAKCDGGYVVAPPSLHPSGRRYEWVDRRAEITTAPTWLLAQLEARQTPRVSDGATETFCLDSGQLGTEGARARLRGLVQTVANAPEGERHNKLVWAAAKAGNITATGALDPAYAASELQAAAERAGLPTAEARRAIADGLAKGELTPDHLEKAKPSPTSPYSDMWLAQRIVEQADGDVLFDPYSKGYVVWDGVVWRTEPGMRVQQLAQDVATRLLIEASEAPPEFREEAQKNARRSQSAARLDAMVKVARPNMTCDPDDFDADRWLLNCHNGVVDLKTGERLEHSRERMMTKITATAYDPEAEAPQWCAFLKQVLPDRDERLFFQRLAGSVLVGEVVGQYFVQHIGPGASGKSTALDTLLHVLGDYAAPFDARRLTAVGGAAGAEPELVRLRGSRLAIASEPSDRYPLDEGVIKWITGGDPITARGLYQNPIDFLPSHMLWIMANSRLQIRGTDTGIWRRVLIVMWRVSIPEDERDARLPARLREEAAGILRWMVDGCLQWQKRGFDVPDSLRREAERYRSSSDHYGQFIADCLQPARGCQTPNQDLKRAFQDWCEANTDAPLSFSRLGRELDRLGYETYKSGGVRGRRGLRLVEDVEDPPF